MTTQAPMYSDPVLNKLQKDTENFLHFLQECKYSGSWDTKVDLNTIIKRLANYQFVAETMRKVIKEQEGKIANLEQDLRAINERINIVTGDANLTDED